MKGKKFEKTKKPKRIHFKNRLNIRHQLYLAYITAGVIPVLIIAAFSSLKTFEMFSNYNQRLLRSYCERVSTTLFEITTQVYNESESIAYNTSLWEVLGTDYKNPDAAKTAVKNLGSRTSAGKYYNAIDNISIYTENPTIGNVENVYYADEEIRSESWYKRAIDDQSPFWYSLTRKDKYGNRYWNLAIIRQIPAVSGNYESVLVIRLSDSYLRTRLTENQYDYAIAVNKGKISSSSEDDYYGLPISTVMPVDYSVNDFTYNGSENIGDDKYMIHGISAELYRTDSRIYICGLNGSIYRQLYEVSLRNFILIAAALIIPFFIIRMFSGHLSGRIVSLRESMHKVAEGEYDIPSDMAGNDEISQTFTDLLDTAKQIKEKNSRIYEVQLAEKDMKLKVLQGQMNPHFLYNTLETIRMKALTNGDREVSGMIKALGKILRFTLDNSRKSEVTLDKAMPIIDSYISIMTMRMGDRMSVKVNIDNSIEPGKTIVPPFIIQPVLENALLHGLADRSEGGLVTLGVTLKEREGGKCLLIRVTDNGAGMDHETLAALRKRIENDDNSGRHIGLANINRRLTLAYGADYGLTVDSEQGNGTVVLMTLPYITVNDPDKED